jgi:hypothetical protein
MLNILKRLFGYDLKPEKELHGSNLPRTYDLSEIKQQATLIKKTRGYSEAIQYLKEKLDLEIDGKDDALSLLAKLIPYMVRNKCSIEEIDSFLTTQILRYNSKFSYSDTVSISYLILKYDRIKGVEFIERNLENLKKREVKDTSLISLHLLLSEDRIEKKDYDDAFIQIRNAYLYLNPYLDCFTYLSYYISIVENEIKLFTNQKRWEPAMHSSINCSFALLAKDIRSFSLNEFNRKKSYIKNGDWSAFDTIVIEKGLKELNIESNLEVYLSRLNDFAFNELPIKLDVPREVIDSPSLESNREYSRLLFELANSPIDITVFHSFSKDLAREFVD